jgi:hypothetical protein
MKKTSFWALLALVVWASSCASDNTLNGKIEATRALLNENNSLNERTLQSVVALVEKTNRLNTTASANPAFAEAKIQVEAINDKYNATSLVLAQSGAQLEQLSRDISAGSLDSKAAQEKYELLDNQVKAFKATLEGIGRVCHDIDTRLSVFDTQGAAPAQGESATTSPNVESRSETPANQVAPSGGNQVTPPDVRKQQQKAAESRKGDNLPPSQTLTGSQGAKKQ